MAVYFRGSKCGRFIKVGATSEPMPNGRYASYEKNAHRFIEFSHPLAYVTTIGGNDWEAEARIKRYFAAHLVDKKRHGDEVFHVGAILPYVAWLRLQWFTETDSSGNSIPEAIDYNEFGPMVERVSCNRREEDLTTALEEADNPFWFLPDVTVEPDEDFFTPSAFIEPVRTAFGGTIDLDVASHPKANRVVRAKNYFTKSENGLERPWFGKAWMSPRTKDMDVWTKKAVHELNNQNVQELICLIGTRACASHYFKPLLQRAEAICIVTGGGPTFDGRGALTENNSNDRWHFIYCGLQIGAFQSAMKDLGTCFVWNGVRNY